MKRKLLHKDRSLEFQAHCFFTLFFNIFDSCVWNRSLKRIASIIYSFLVGKVTIKIINRENIALENSTPQLLLKMECWCYDCYLLSVTRVKMANDELQYLHGLCIDSQVLLKNRMRLFFYNQVNSNSKKTQSNAKLTFAWFTSWLWW